MLTRLGPGWAPRRSIRYSFGVLRAPGALLCCGALNFSRRAPQDGEETYLEAEPHPDPLVWQ